MGNHCLYCQSTIKEIITWKGLFRSDPQYLCGECQKGLQPIEGQRCSYCSRSLEKLPDELKKDEVCLDCYRWEEEPSWKGILQKNTSLLEYNDFLKEYLARYKYRGDYILAKAFGTQLANHLKPLQFDHIIPIPLSNERQYERGFNQSAALLEEAGISLTHLLTRSHSEKQSKKSRQERLQQKQIFTLTEVNLTGQSILLFDDIYTTGTTLRQAAKLLKEAGAKQVTSLTLARG
ncbi:phosphoribosyltransferase [[Bacillus] enclensis]|uniref:Competence protein ComFC n=1 Tax=[Bacillus] enclensis TaxID=1402860 RepID=A0A0V8HBK5_9BACI|nr:ComF family protein [[Bacillus] enclensis]KSU59823.1 phosphoribosyltransferase [[Bacillus] enclensis]SCC27737.1 competence protein ComFC [[Bacillus] enclensis]